MDEYLTKNDFQHFEDRLWKRFDVQDAITRTLGERIAVTDALANKNEKRLDDFKTDTRKTATVWGGGVGTAAAAFCYTAINMWFGGKGGSQ